MSDRLPESQENAELPLTARPEELPPVEPPSASFIIQLFVVPGLIVAAIVGAWWLFGKLASSEQDWQALVQDMRSDNEHRRGRAAHGLATLLSIDQHRKDDGGPRLSMNPQVAQELSQFLAEMLKSSSPDEATIEQQKGLTQTLWLIDASEVTFPVLREALQSKHDREVRKNALLGISAAAFRASERGTPLSGDGIVEEIVEVAKDDDRLLRSTAAFALGFFPAKMTQQPLLVLLADADADVRANAAIACTRQKSLAGLPVLREVLKTATETKTAPAAGDSSRVAISMVMKSAGDLAALLDDATRKEFATSIEAISRSYPDQRVRFDAAQALQKLRGP